MNMVLAERPSSLASSHEDPPDHDVTAPPERKKRTINWALLILLSLTAVAYLWNLTRNGYGNEFYAAAVQAGTKSWKAFLFGSADASNAITVDKTPGSLWLMELSGRIFGFSSFSMLLPNALEGIASVGLVYASVTRWFGTRAALFAGAMLAITPAAALMFRFNNPDAALVFVLCLAAYFVTRAVDGAKTKWMLLTGVALGFAFLVKEMQAFLVVPGFALAYLVCAPTTLRKRITDLLVGLVAMLATAGWWLALVELWPKASRPYFGGSSNNSIFDIIFGYNGIGRLTGSGTGNGGGGGGGGLNFSGTAGIFRMFNDLVGGQISWLLPASLIALVSGLVMCRRLPRTNKALAALIIWGGWLLVTSLTLSFASGTIHTYYTVALAPAVAAVIAIVVSRMWEQREKMTNRLVLSATIAITSVWAFVLLERTSAWLPWLKYGVLLAAAVAVIGLLGAVRKFGLFIATVALIACLSGPAAYALDTVNSTHTGSIPSAGPTGTSGGGMQGIGGGDTQVSAQAIALLKADASKYRWVAAAESSNSSAPYQLATGDPVMSIGGFSGSDPSPTLAAFEDYVNKGDIHYFISGGQGGGRGMGGSSGTTSQISTWVTAHFKSITIGNTTFYDLTQRTS